MDADNGRPFSFIPRKLFFFTAFLFVCFASALYIAGSALDFTERTQFFLLNVIIYSGLFNAFCALIDLAVSASAALSTGKKRILASSFVFLILGAVSFILSAAAAFIMVLTKGNIE
ncbi:MAG: hypothetical protein LBJ86_01460 [Spirochaetaceae bacterium]|jgi:hypothetical protein|nr:hypothetical protein [Spirochaetaceae bacterium]